MHRRAGVPQPTQDADASARAGWCAMAPMVEMVGKVTRSRYDELVADSLDMVEEDTRCQFGLGDAALELEPLRGHGGHLPLDEGDQGVEESLRLFADEIGLSFYTVRTQRWVAAQWPVEHRQAGVSWEVHRILASVADRFELIGNPPLSERTGRRRWSAEVAKKVVGWKTEEVQVPVTTEEKVEAIRELARDDEAVAAQVATDFLRRPEVAFRAMRDAEARENVNEAQFEQAGLEDDEFDEEYEDAFGEEGESFDDPARIVHSWRRSMEFTDLIAVCQGFIAGAARLVPKLRGHEFTDTQTKVLENHLEKIRATADWIQTAAATGQVDLDEQLAQLLRGQ
ncbi:RacO protein [Streptomyces sp. WAC 01325]|uniref:DUF6192 family protein n=1 Tax=Streptomyces sp. WAC 01325 TaxID=2203202 RepID=UPI000F8827CF|nr:DUF6192 family protein [Streptomyces sp. WAC 01325]RSN14832.1 RacO protein [Streptomyces sp. WAC 01325]